MNESISRRNFLQSSASGLAVAPFVSLANAGVQKASKERPNIVWIIVEDTSAHFGCYGDKQVRTPHVDRMAKEGVKFNNAFITCPVCSPARSAMITGMYQTSIGAQHHRSGRGVEKIHLPAQVKLIPRIFKENGYYTCNGSLGGKKNAIDKTDYNFEWDKQAYDSGDWAGRKEGQPFFAQIQLHGGKLRHGKAFAKNIESKLPHPIKPEDVTLPPYYPDHPVIREDWAQYLNTVQHTDYEAGLILKRLEDEGILDNTYVFFITDHGISHARGKQYLYDEGIHIPFVVRGPGIKAGSERDDLIVHIDMAATSMALAGIPIPDYMQAKDVLAKDYQPRKYIVSARDRCDETVERLRCVRTDRYKYIRNFYPKRPHLQPNRYKDNKEIIKTIRRLHEEGKLNAVQSLLTVSERPKEELYDLKTDPWEIKNLAGKPEYQDTLKKLRGTLEKWIVESNDHSQQPETMKMYDSDMAVYLTNKSPDQAKVLERNIGIMKKWAAEGK